MYKRIRSVVGIIVLGLAFAATTSASEWVATGNLNNARTGHTATLLSDGKVLVLGGANGQDYVDGAELYDPVAGTWSVTGRPNGPHNGHTATLLPNGQVLVVGGGNVAELYDPGTGTWARTGAPSTNRSDHTATLLKSGKVLIAGGSSAAGITELYDPATGTWSRTGSLAKERALHGATLLQDGRVLVTGGTNDADYIVPLDTAELYDPVAGTWSNTPGPHDPRHSHTATLLPDGRVLVAGGYSLPYEFPSGCYSRPSGSCTVTDVPTNSAELYDPATARWSYTGSLNTAQAGPTAALLPDGSVLVAGGSGVEINRAELYDAGRAVWNYTTAINTARYGHTATLLQNGNVLIAGGYGGGKILNSAELYESGVPSVPSVRPISAGFTGSWYDPAQSGHGFTLEVLAGVPQQMLAYWFTFAPQGDQSWIAALGPIDGNRAVVQGLQTIGAGARFPPNFDAANARQDSWGTLTFTFSDCNHGHVDWSSTVAGYGGGGMDLTRLTMPAGLSCSP